MAFNYRIQFDTMTQSARHNIEAIKRLVTNVFDPNRWRFLRSYSHLCHQWTHHSTNVPSPGAPQILGTYRLITATLAGIMFASMVLLMLERIKLVEFSANTPTHTRIHIHKHLHSQKSTRTQQTVSRRSREGCKIPWHMSGVWHFRLIMLLKKFKNFSIVESFDEVACWRLNGEDEWTKTSQSVVCRDDDDARLHKLIMSTRGKWAHYSAGGWLLCSRALQEVFWRALRECFGENNLLWSESIVVRIVDNSKMLTSI